MSNKELLEYGRQYEEIVQMVAPLFEKNYSAAGANQKAKAWMREPNPLLGYMSPRDMIRCGKFEKLKKFIETSLRENENPAADAIKAQQGAAK